ncbi:hypothetical protein BDY19DRAFT_923309 [Irpex rosettiformis]|uniref:Uncharacterized protein n=1 Tax=Irpex rosettiformis TaxID=378272 RepID=A0ACB8UGC4_9APHY|nr:hypothetical protein BDY19DRAFT_923309 [Irpex rosettiformis]
MAPCVEIFRAAASDLYLSEGIESIQPVLDILNKTEGHIASYTGTEVQDPNYWWAIIVWETVEHHHALINNTKVYPAFCDSLNKAVANLDFTMLHAVLTPNDPYPALEAPLTELTMWKLHEGTDRTKFTDILAPLMTKGIEELPVQTGGWGATIEEPNTFAIILGWENMEVFKGTGVANPWIGEGIVELKTLAELNVRHAVFQKHAK